MCYAIDSPDKNRIYFSNSFRIIAIGFLVLLLGAPILVITGLVGDNIVLFYLLYISNAIYTLLSYYARALEKIPLVGVAGIVNTVVVVVCNILFLVVFDLGVFGYLLSYVLGYLVGTIIFVFPLRKYITFRRFDEDRQASKELIRFSLPLVPNSVSWWGVSTANKYIINGFLETSVLGIYSVALKIPTIVNTIQSILAEALVLSVLKEYSGEEKDQGYFTLLYRVYNFSITLVTSIIIVFTKLLAHFLFAKEFFEAWMFVPLLCIPSVWGALAGYLGTFYSAEKRNNGIFISTLLGGIVTIATSLLTIRTIGIYGVIVGTILSYIVIWLYRWIDVKKYVRIETNMLIDIGSWIILFLQAIVVMFVSNIWLAYIVNSILIVILFWLNIDIIKKFISSVLKK